MLDRNDTHAPTGPVAEPLSGVEHDVCIVGTGRVGLPLGLSLAEVGVAATGLDRDEDLCATVNAGRMPFDEPGYDDLVATGDFRITTDPSVVSRSRAVVITVGTPLMNHIETDLSQILAVLAQVRPHLRRGHLLCLRSTVAPGTTEFVAKWLERATGLTVGQDLFIAFCPERIAEGKAHTELRELPQIIGAQDPVSAERAAALFQPLGTEVMPTDFVTAELVKLFNNIARYVHFAVANQFAMIADQFGANYYEARRLANHRYTRSSLASPGFTAGTCLRKDFGMVNEWSAHPDLMLSAWKVNESMPVFLVDHMARRTELEGRHIAILGFSFKSDTDDLRDSLAPKLWRYLQRRMPESIMVSDHHLPDPIPEDSVGRPRNVPADEALQRADIVFVATNHTGYGDLLRELAVSRPEVWVGDLWNVGMADKVFYRAGELLPDTPDTTAGGDATPADNTHQEQHA